MMQLFPESLNPSPILNASSSRMMVSRPSPPRIAYLTVRSCGSHLSRRRSNAICLTTLSLPLDANDRSASTFSSPPPSPDSSPASHSMALASISAFCTTVTRMCSHTPRVPGRFWSDLCSSVDGGQTSHVQVAGRHSGSAPAVGSKQFVSCASIDSLGD